MLIKTSGLSLTMPATTDNTQDNVHSGTKWTSLLKCV